MKPAPRKARVDERHDAGDRDHGQDGRYCKSGTRRGCTSARSTTSTTATEDSVTSGSCGICTTAPRGLKKFVTTATWAYTTGTWRSLNNSTANRVEVFPRSERGTGRPDADALRDKLLGWLGVLRDRGSTRPLRRRARGRSWAAAGRWRTTRTTWPVPGFGPRLSLLPSAGIRRDQRHVRQRITGSVRPLRHHARVSHANRL